MEQETKMVKGKKNRMWVWRIQKVRERKYWKYNDNMESSERRNIIQGKEWRLRNQKWKKEKAYVVEKKKRELTNQKPRRQEKDKGKENATENWYVCLCLAPWIIKKNSESNFHFTLATDDQLQPQGALFIYLCIIYKRYHLL